MHGITVDGKDNVWLPTNQGHQMLKFTRQGKFLLQIGREGQSKGNTDTANLNRAAEAEVDLAANEVYVADGYGNRRVIVFDADTGAYKRHWGAYGKKPDDTDPGPYNPAAPIPQVFRTVHCAQIANDGLVYVCDRANDRIQVFRKDGTFVKEKQIAKDTLGDGVDLRHRVLARHARSAMRSSPTARTIACGRCCAIRSRSSATSAAAGGIPASSTPCTTSRSIRRATSTRLRRTKASACRSSTTKASGRLRRRRTELTLVECSRK